MVHSFQFLRDHERTETRAWYGLCGQSAPGEGGNMKEQKRVRGTGFVATAKRRRSGEAYSQAQTRLVLDRLWWEDFVLGQSQVSRDDPEN